MEKRKISCLIILLLVSSSLWAQQYWLVASKGIVKYKHNDKNVKLETVFFKKTDLSLDDIIVTDRAFTICNKDNDEAVIDCPSAPNGTKLRELISKRSVYKTANKATVGYKGENFSISNVIKSELSVSSSVNFHYLIVGVNEYEDSHWEQLPVPKVNVDKLTKAIKEVMIPNNNYNLINSKQLLNSDETTRYNILSNLKILADSVKPNNNDVVMLYLSSHGVKDVNNKFYIITSDSHFDSLSLVPQNSISADTLIACVNRLADKGAKVLCFVDACYSGTIIMYSKQSSGNCVYFMSTANDLVAYEDENNGSPFARALTRSLSGEEQYFFKAVSNNYVTPENLQDYLFTSVRNERMDQSPVTWRSDDLIGKQKLWHIKPSYSMELDSLITAAEYGNTDAMVKLGDVYGDSITASKYKAKQEMAKAIEYYEWAYELKNAMAACRLGQYYYYLPTPNYDKAFNYFRESAGQNCNLGIYYLFVCYVKGCGIKKNKKKARKTLEKLFIIDDDIMKAFAKEQVFYPIEMDISPFYPDERVQLNSDNGKVSMTMHVDVYRKSDDLFYIFKKAEKGNAKYQAKLGDILYCGLFYNPDYEGAYEMYKKSADQGNKDGLYGLALMCARGLPIKKDYKLAADFFLESGKLGLSKSYVLCGKLYFEGGYGLEKDKRQAVELWKKAAEMKDAEGLYLYGLCLKDSVQLAPDESKAYDCILQSANAGFVDAQYMVGYFLYNGIGVEKNRQEAYHWLVKAKDKGNENAKKLIYNCYYADGTPREN